MNYLKCLASCFGRDGNSLDDLNLRKCESLKTFDALKKMFHVKKVKLHARWDIYGIAVVSSVLSGVLTWGTREHE